MAIFCIVITMNNESMQHKIKSMLRKGIQNSSKISSQDIKRKGEVQAGVRHSFNQWLNWSASSISAAHSPQVI